MRKVQVLKREFWIQIGAIALLARTILSDILPPEKLVRLGTLIGTMWGLGPVIGPFLIQSQ